MFCFLLLEAQSSRFPTGENNLPQMANIQCKCVRHLASVRLLLPKPHYSSNQLVLCGGLNNHLQKMVEVLPQKLNWDQVRTLRSVFISVKTLLVHNLFANLLVDFGSLPCWKHYPRGNSSQIKGRSAFFILCLV